MQKLYTIEIYKDKNGKSEISEYLKHLQTQKTPRREIEKAKRL